MKKRKEFNEYDFMTLLCSKMVMRKINIFSVNRLEKKLFEFSIDKEYSAIFKNIAVNIETEKVNIMPIIEMLCTIGTLVPLNYPERIVIPFMREEAEKKIADYSEENSKLMDNIVNGIYGKPEKKLVLKCCD